MSLPNTRQIDLSDPSLREKYGLRQEGIETVSKPSQWRQERRDYRSRADTQELVLQMLRESDRPLSLREMHIRLGRSKSPFFCDLIAEMVALKLIRMHEKAYRHLIMFVYEVAECS